ncbi:MAG: ABC transporter permease subunit [Microbacteriaceae bacterium]|nr:ABC transporter permease subunit [Microbacteriaceae bacterium]
MNTVARIVAPIVVGVLLLALWWALSANQGRTVLVPTPGMVGEELVAHGDIVLKATWITALNALIGLGLGTLLAIVLAGVAAWLRVVDWMAAPVVAAISVVPIVALTPILNTMFGASSQFGRQLIAALAAFVPVFVNVLRGLRQAKPVQRDLFAALGARGGQTFAKLTLPTAVPYLFTGLRIASSLAVISALVAEYFGGPSNGLGTAIASYAKSGKASLAWAHVAAAIAVGLVFFLVTVLIERIVAKRIPV